MNYEKFQADTRKIDNTFLYDVWFVSYYCKVCGDKMPTSIPVRKHNGEGGIRLERVRQQLTVVELIDDDKVPFGKFFSIGDKMHYREFLRRYQELRDESNRIYSENIPGEMVSFLEEVRPLGGKLINCILGVQYPFKTVHPNLPKFDNCLNISGDGGTFYKFQYVGDGLVELRWDADDIRESPVPPWFRLEGVKVGGIYTLNEIKNLSIKAVEANRKYFQERYPRIFNRNLDA